MSMISSAIPNLCRASVNNHLHFRHKQKSKKAFPSLVEGLQKRPPLEYVATMRNQPTAGNFTHLINRDTTERYFVFINASNQIEV